MLLYEKNTKNIKSFSTFYLITPLAVETINRQKRLKETDVNPLVAQTSTKISALIKQPNLRFQLTFYVIFVREGHNVDDVKESYLEIVNDVSV